MIVNEPMMDLVAGACDVNIKVDHLTHLKMKCRPSRTQASSVREFLKSACLREIEIISPFADLEQKDIHKCYEGILMDSKDVESLTLSDNLQQLVNILPTRLKLRELKLIHRYQHTQILGDLIGKVREIQFLTKLTIDFSLIRQCETNCDGFEKLMGGVSLTNQESKTRQLYYVIIRGIDSENMHKIMKILENAFTSSECYIGGLKLEL
jgi:hypothetical protein